MPIELPNLDDRRFKELVEEGKRLIPAHALSWTDHNPSDPGITFVELFAFIAEMLMYRVNRISEDNKRVFVKLLLGEEPDENVPIDSEIRRAIKQLRTEERAVTPVDFERLAMKTPDVAVARAHCLPQRNLESGKENAVDKEANSHVSVIVIPAPDNTTKQKIKVYLQERSLLATRLHVVPAKFLKIGIRVTVHIFSDRKEEEMKPVILETLSHYFDRLTGGNAGTGWPFGHPVYVSDLYALLDNIDGVDYIERSNNDKEVFVVDGQNDEDRAIPNANAKEFLGLQLEEDELVDFSREQSDLSFKRSETEQFD
ncbi:MAG: hypothetical protein KDF59_12710 [Nitrosomonas sp.]|nr:hypothetical protein [Nitrosomonas sp.]